MTSKRLSPKTIEEIRLGLIERKKELSGRLDHLREESALGNPRDLGEISSLPTHLADLGTETCEQDTTLGLAERVDLEVREIQQALDRIEEGSYGICVKCARRIVPERLSAAPSAPRCTRCQADLEAA